MKKNVFNNNFFKYITCITLLLLMAACAQPIEEVNSHLITGDIDILKKFPKTKALGIVWDKYPIQDAANPKPQPVFPVKDVVSVTDESVTDPCVIKTVDAAGVESYHMWYTLVSPHMEAGEIKFYRYSIGYAGSVNGIDWVGNIGDPIQGLTPERDLATGEVINTYDAPIKGGMRVNSVLRVKDGNGTYSYRMWYLGKTEETIDGDWKMFYADSHDGVIWERSYYDSMDPVFGNLQTRQGEFFENEIGRGAVIFDKTETNSNFKMWFSGFNGDNINTIGFASSKEGTDQNWKVYSELPIIDKGFSGYFDISKVENPVVLKDGDVYKMWYSGFKHNWRLGLAYSLDGKRFYYYDSVHEVQEGLSVMRPYSGGGARWERLGITGASVIKDVTELNGKSVTTYKMWYSAKGNLGTFRIGYAESYYTDSDIE